DAVPRTDYSLRLEDFLHLFMELGDPNVLVEDIQIHDNGKTLTHLVVCGKKCPQTRAIKEARKSYEKMYDEYGHRSKTKDQADWKSLYHAVRIAGECKELLSTSWITLPRPDAEYLKRIRLGEFHYDEVI